MSTFHLHFYFHYYHLAQNVLFSFYFGGYHLDARVILFDFIELRVLLPYRTHNICTFIYILIFLYCHFVQAVLFCFNFGGYQLNARVMLFDFLELLVSLLYIEHIICTSLSMITI